MPKCKGERMALSRLVVIHLCLVAKIVWARLCQKVNEWRHQDSRRSKVKGWQYPDGCCSSLSLSQDHLGRALSKGERMAPSRLCLKKGERLAASKTTSFIFVSIPHQDRHGQALSKGERIALSRLIFVSSLLSLSLIPRLGTLL